MWKRMAACGLLVLAIPVSSAWASPAWHLGTFDMGAPSHCGGLSWCGSVASDVLRNAGMNPSQQGRDLVTGDNGDTAVIVLCTPTSPTTVQAAVIAVSNSSVNAESWRNSIRQQMIGARCL